jgi:hypothetical protein
VVEGRKRRRKRKRKNGPICIQRGTVALLLSSKHSPPCTCCQRGREVGYIHRHTHTHRHMVVVVVVVVGM